MDRKSLPDAAKKDATALHASEPPKTRAQNGDEAPARVRQNLPREWRLVRRAEYEAVYRGGRRRSNQTFAIFVRPNGFTRNRFGMSVKKALGNAVVRNRIRRRIREILRLHREEMAAGWDVVIHPSKSVATLKFTKIEAELLSLMPREKRAAE
ncbi:MAG: ribonuclease P protein component [Candidatus Acidiferrales bacterium]